MFWNDQVRLREMKISSKVAITAFLICSGIGYLLGFLNIVLAYSPVDEQPGMSVADIRMSFYGKRESTKLEKSVDGSMKQYFQTDAGYQTVKAWLAAGATEEEFGTSVKPIFDVSCSTCHSEAAKVANVVTANFENLGDLLVQDMGKSASRLVSLSHTHLLGTIPILFLMVLVFSFTRYSEPVKTVIMGFGFLSILADIGSWWLAKAVSWGAVMVILGGSTLGISFAALALLPLYDMWLRKAD